jgi:serine/threonine protein phosphatase PrpC
MGEGEVVSHPRGYAELCFLPGVCKKQHADKAKVSAVDADAVALTSHMLGVCDGVSQVEQFGIRPDELPVELLEECSAAAEAQLSPVGNQLAYAPGFPKYGGLIELLVDAYKNTTSHGSTTVLLTALDHSKGRPMLHVLNLGDCELVVLNYAYDQWNVKFRTTPQRVDGHRQQPYQLSRVDETIDPDFVEELHAIPFIRKGTQNQLVEVDIDDLVIMGSDGVFDNLFLEEIVDLVDLDGPASQEDMSRIARAIVDEAHSRVGGNGDTPMGKGAGGKADDTTLVVASIIPMHSDEARAIWGALPSFRSTKLGLDERSWDVCAPCNDVPAGEDSEDEEEMDGYSVDEYEMQNTRKPARNAGRCDTKCSVQ